MISGRGTIMPKKLTPGIEQTLRGAAKSIAIKKKLEKKREEKLVEKVKRTLRMIYYGKEYHQVGQKRKVKPTKKKLETVRTKTIIEKGLKPAGLTEAEIKRLQGKK